MAKDKKPAIGKLIDREIRYILEELDGTNPDDESYKVLVDRLDELYEVKLKERSWKVSPETLAVLGANLLGIVIILKYEEMNVITSKAFSFVGKGRV